MWWIIIIVLSLIVASIYFTNTKTPPPVKENIMSQTTPCTGVIKGVTEQVCESKTNCDDKNIDLDNPIDYQDQLV